MLTKYYFTQYNSKPLNLDLFLDLPPPYNIVSQLIDQTYQIRWSFNSDFPIQSYEVC